MHTLYANEVKDRDEAVTRQIFYLAQGADPPFEVKNIVQSVLKLLSEFPAFAPKLLGLQLPEKAAKQTVLGLVGSVHYYIGTQVHHLALTVLFSPLIDPRRHFQLLCSHHVRPPHLTDYRGRILLDTCPHVGLLETVRWFIAAVERLLTTGVFTMTPRPLGQSSMDDIWASTEFYRELCVAANQQYNALTAELGERQRTVVEELGSTRHRGSSLASIATRLAKDMSVALELISDGNREYEGTDTVAASPSSVGAPQHIQPKKTPESDLRASEVARLLANLSAVDGTILDIIETSPTQEFPVVTATVLRSVRDALGELTEKALNLRYAIYSMSQDISEN